MFDILDSVETLVDEALQIGFKLADVHIEFDKVSIKPVVAEV